MASNHMGDKMFIRSPLTMDDHDSKTPSLDDYDPNRQRHMVTIDPKELIG